MESYLDHETFAWGAPWDKKDDRFVEVEEDLPWDRLGWLPDAVKAGFAIACISRARRADDKPLRLSVLEPVIEDVQALHVSAPNGVAQLSVLERAHRLDRLSIDASARDAVDLSALPTLRTYLGPASRHTASVTRNPEVTDLTLDAPYAPEPLSATGAVESMQLYRLGVAAPVTLTQPKALRRLRVADSKNLDLRLFESATGLEDLFLQSCTVTGLEAVSAWPNLHRLWIHSCVLEGSAGELLNATATDVVITTRPRLSAELRGAFRARGWETN